MWMKKRNREQVNDDYLEWIYAETGAKQDCPGVCR